MTQNLEPPKELIEKWTAEFETDYGHMAKDVHGMFTHRGTREAHRYYIKGRTAGWHDLQRVLTNVKLEPEIRPGASPRMNRGYIDDARLKR